MLSQEIQAWEETNYSERTYGSKTTNLNCCIQGNVPMSLNHILKRKQVIKCSHSGDLWGGGKKGTANRRVQQIGGTMHGLQNDRGFPVSSPECQGVSFATNPSYRTCHCPFFFGGGVWVFYFTITSSRKKPGMWDRDSELISHVLQP